MYKNFFEFLNNLDSIITSLSKPEYTIKDCQPIQSNEASKVFTPLKTDDETNTSVIERR